MSRLTFAQKRIRACDRILRKEYWNLKRSMKRPAEPEVLKNEDIIQDRINYFEETRERIEISL